METRFEWDEAKNEQNQRKHSISFEEAIELFTSGVDYLEVFDEAHADHEDRFICIGPIRRGVVVVVTTEPDDDALRLVSARLRRSARLPVPPLCRGGIAVTDDIKELTEADFERAIPARLRKKFIRGQFDSGSDIAALRKFVGLTQVEFAKAMGISVHTLRNWEQGRRKPEGPAVSLLRIAARHPRVLRENLRSVV